MHVPFNNQISHISTFTNITSELRKNHTKPLQNHRQALHPLFFYDKLNVCTYTYTQKIKTNCGIC